MTNDLWKTLTLVNEWIRFSEGKAIALLTIQGVLLAVLSQSLLADNHSFSFVEYLLASVAIFMNAASILTSFACLEPRLKLKGGISPIYFNCIASNFANSSEYADYYKSKMANEDSVMEELCGQIYVNSEIATVKYKYISYSIRLFLGAMFIWVVYLIEHIIC